MPTYLIRLGKYVGTFTIIFVVHVHPKNPSKNINVLVGGCGGGSK
jgi:hypothetical protein